MVSEADTYQLLTIVVNVRLLSYIYLLFSLFAGTDVPDPVNISLEYLALCKNYPGTALPNIQTHIQHFIEFQWYVV